jgi:hypothetical protein
VGVSSVRQADNDGYGGEKPTHPEVATDVKAWRAHRCEEVGDITDTRDGKTVANKIDEKKAGS